MIQEYNEGLNEYNYWYDEVYVIYESSCNKIRYKNPQFLFLMICNDKKDHTRMSSRYKTHNYIKNIGPF